MWRSLPFVSFLDHFEKHAISNNISTFKDKRIYPLGFLRKRYLCEEISDVVMHRCLLLSDETFKHSHSPFPACIALCLSDPNTSTASPI